MADSEEIILEYFYPGSDTAKSFEEYWEMQDDETGELIDFDPTAAFLSISQDGRRLKLFTLGDGLIWITETKSMYLSFLNNQLRFIREDSSMEFNFWIETPDGAIKSIIENGTVTAVRVS
ncbi:hypothetical protein HT136_08490 [Novosphingobium profundi]|uniref:hypothetical protein n=1 Tax=Novosphingobium profundi TaxID=1774954 RepID=UPI001BD9B04B|nr:hypothetical protein [Novosphingobium profundi]MBT0668406.1 hypothetical protein [Novosphingobium profundi]